MTPRPNTHNPGYRPCPRCAADAPAIVSDLDPTSRKWQTRCTRCGATTGWCISVQLAFDRWQHELLLPSTSQPA